MPIANGVHWQQRKETFPLPARRAAETYGVKESLLAMFKALSLAPLRTLTEKEKAHGVLRAATNSKPLQDFVSWHYTSSCIRL